MTKTIPLSFQQDLSAGNTKAAMKTVGASSGDLWRVPVDSFVVLPGLNVRTKSDAYEAHIDSLVQSILAEGYFQDKPIAVFVASVAPSFLICLIAVPADTFPAETRFFRSSGASSRRSKSLT